MYSFEAQGFTFLHHGDYSGEIRILSGSDPEIVTNLPEIISLALQPSASEPFARAHFLNKESEAVTVPMVGVRSLVADVLRSEAIRRLEQTQTAEILSNPYLRSIAEELAKP